MTEKWTKVEDRLFGDRWYLKMPEYSLAFELKTSGNSGNLWVLRYLMDSTKNVPGSTLTGCIYVEAQTVEAAQAKAEAQLRLRLEKVQESISVVLKFLEEG